MSKIKCPACKKLTDESKNECEKCGHVINRPLKTIEKIGVAIVVLAIIGGIFVNIYEFFMPSTSIYDKYYDMNLSHCKNTTLGQSLKELWPGDHEIDEGTSVGGDSKIYIRFGDYSTPLGVTNNEIVLSMANSKYSSGEPLAKWQVEAAINCVND